MKKPGLTFYRKRDSERAMRQSDRLSQLPTPVGGTRDVQAAVPGITPQRIRQTTDSANLQNG